MDFRLKFKGGRVKGKGADAIGNFVWSGTYDSNAKTVTMVKQYIGKHSVQYVGTKTGEKKFEGTWSVGSSNGAFLLQKGKRH